MSAIRRLTYVSRAVAGAGANLLSVSEILGESQRNNARVGLAGKLIAHDGWFLQAIEGDRGHIDQLMGRLQRDGRHRDIRVLSDETADDRIYGDWSMAQATITPGLGAVVADRSLDALSAPEAKDLLLAAA